MTVYECGNYSEEEPPPEECPLCGSPERDEQPSRMSTVVVDCPGWEDYDSE
jgi:hypothetical protein